MSRDAGGENGAGQGCGGIEGRKDLGGVEAEAEEVVQCRRGVEGGAKAGFEARPSHKARGQEFKMRCRECGNQAHVETEGILAAVEERFHAHPPEDVVRRYFRRDGWTGLDQGEVVGEKEDRLQDLRCEALDAGRYYRRHRWRW